MERYDAWREMALLDKDKISRECDVYVLSVNFTPLKSEPVMDILVIYAEFKVLDNLEWECRVSTYIQMPEKSEMASYSTTFITYLLPTRDKILREGLRLVYGQEYVCPGVD